MKPLIITLAFAFLSLTGFGQAETAATPKPVKLAKNYFYLSPFNLIASQFQVGYERDFGKKHSMLFLPGVIVGNNYYYYNSSADEGTDYGFTGELQYRYHIVSVTNPRGKAKNAFRFDFYAAPFAGYQYLNYNAEIYHYDETDGSYYYTYDNVKNHAVTGGLLFGTRFTFFERFSIDVYAGGGVKYSNSKNAQYNYDYGVLRPGYTGIIGKAGLQIGIAF